MVVVMGGLVRAERGDQAPLFRKQDFNAKITCCCLENAILSIPLECESSHYQAFSRRDNAKHNVFYITVA